MSARPARAIAVALLATLAALLTALVPATAAHAASRTVQGGRLDWGIKSSFQSYVTGPVAKGGFKLKNGAATVGGSLFRFHSATGSYDPDTGAFEASFSGGVQFQGHQKPDGAYELDLSVSRPTIKINGGSGTLYADVSSKAKDTGVVTTESQVPFASLGLGGVNMAGGGSPIALTNIPVTLTAQGAKSFAGYYTAGAQLDPISLSADVKAAPEGGQSSAPAGSSPSAQPSGSASPQGSRAPGAFVDAAVDWGVRRTFREYVTGSIGQGKWTLADGARDGGALFRFGQGKGSFDGEKGALDAAFAGTVHFTGAHLDLKLGAVTAKVQGGRGVLSADVTTAGATKSAVPLVEFDAKGLKTEGGLATLTEAPATLTEDGSRAFNSMYKAGTEMDPVSLAVALDAGARLPALPDLGSTASSSSASAAAPAPARNAADGSSDTGTYIAVGVAVLVLAGGVAFLTLRKRREPAPASAPAPEDSASEGSSSAAPEAESPDAASADGSSTSSSSPEPGPTDTPRS
ncbi:MULTISPECIES: HtaA domain-containing protein [unclassified Streptomyces]|uniref:HtaA domain-containing protein n=1 Tax=unclassified Streptomyces TaxID=2593676 RepID=UPI0022582A54|nr:MULTISPECIES: HtaA domain-containing protein [unclassified Streptomyces]MCX4525613.1 HtaA domain-containing protein [Streptomyces sp. NBC_01551]MCX4543915.1 HtaA domain-containing protein [Streptomyces sp. NBC_01565]